MSSAAPATEGTDGQQEAGRQVTATDQPRSAPEPEAGESLRAMLARWPEWDVTYSAPLGAWTAAKEYPAFLHMLIAVTPVMLAARIEAAEAAAAVRWAAVPGEADYRLLAAWDEEAGQ